MDTRLKERLIGAVVLVALAVILVPWVLDGPDTAATATSASLSLPVRDQAAPVRTQTIALDHRRDEPAAPAPGPTPAATRPVEPAVAADDTAAARAEAPASASAVAGEAQWAVQLGSFREEENARRLAARVATYGFDAGISTRSGAGRVMYRVRTEAEPSRDRAEAVASALTAHGFVAQVVATD